MNSPTPANSLSSVKLTLMAKRMREQASSLLHADPIAIIGMGCRVPGGGTTPDKFWKLLRNEVNAVTSVPSDRWDGDAWFDPDGSTAAKSVTKHAGFLERIDGFDANYFGIPRREAERMDPQQRLFLEVAIEAIDDAGLPHGKLQGSRTGVYIASYHNDYTHLQYNDLSLVDLRTLTGTLHSVLANRLSYHLDLRGPSISIDTACSSSLVAIHLACQSLRFGETDIAFAGGVSLMVTPELMVSMSKVGFMAPDGQCKTFDARADGFGRGEGCGVIVLRRLSDAIAADDRVLAVIRGSAVNQDGHSTVLAAPHGPAQEELIRQALSFALMEPGRIGFVETHGTGTALGDPIEVEAIANTIGATENGASPCFLGSAKANFGHLEAAAGVTGLIKAVLALRHEAIPAQVNFSRLNPHISLSGTRLRVPTSLEPWPAGSVPRCAAVSSFGVGGTNAHVIIEDAPKLGSRPDEEAKDAAYVLALSAQSPDALRELATSWMHLLPETSETLADLCCTASQRRTHYLYRAAVVGQSNAELCSRLADELKRREASSAAACKVPTSATPHVGFVFCGQGPQWYAMGRQLLAEEPAFREVLTECDALLAPLSGWSLLDQLALPEEDSQLNQTVVAQPALFSIQVALATLLKSYGITPNGITGHSVGEIAALHVAGVLDLAEAVRIVWHRGRIMQQATGGGRMAAISLSEADGAALIEPYGEKLAIAAINAPRSIVLSGDANALNEVLAAAAARGVSHRMMDVPYAFHSAQMTPLQRQLVEEIGFVRRAAPAVPLYSTVTGRSAKDIQFDAAYFGCNVRQSVRFSDAIETMAADGCDVFVEIGPHPVLGLSIAECVTTGGAARPVLATLRRGKPERETLLQTCAGLYAAGCDLDWAAVQPGKGRVATLPAYPWQRERYWLRKRPANRPHGAATGEHPLFATHVVPAAAGMHVFEGDSERAQTWLADHRIFGRLLLPAAAVLEGFSYAAGKALGCDHPQLDHVVIHHPLIIPDPDSGSARWQVVVTTNEAGSAELEWSEMVAGSDAAAPSWRKTASATALKPSSERRSLAALLEGRQCGADEVYGRFSDLGVEFGPAFRCLNSIEYGTSIAQGVVELPDNVEQQGHLLHPVMLDAALQLCSLAAGAASGELLPADIYLPVAADLVVVQAGCYRRLLARARARSVTAEAIVADISLESEHGECVALIEGMRFIRSTADAFVASSSGRDLYDVVWRKAPDLPIRTEPDAERSWLLLTDGQGTADRLAARIEAAGGHAIRVRHGHEFTSRAPRDWTIDPSEPEHYQRLLSELDWHGGHVVHCWNLDIAQLGRETPEASAHDDANGLSSIVWLVQSLVRTKANRGTSLSVVTCGAQVVAAEPADLLCPRAAGAWGLATVIAREHPDLNMRMLDLDPSDALSVDRLLSELADPTSLRLVLRGSERWVPRLRRMDALAANPNMSSDAKTLKVVRPGSYEGVEWQTADQLPLKADDVRVSVVAAGLNFRDVLIPLGMYPEPTALGTECAGVIEEIGAAVTEFNIGDRVFGFAPGSFATQVGVPASFLAPVPETMSLDDAAGVSVAFLTSYYGLVELAGLRAGERVLIHAAAGGVGLAAVQWAQRCGVEVFATAGSPAKRDMLRTLGVKHVFDSRSLDFADEILAATGRGVDVVLNSLANDFIAASLRVLAPDGRFVELGKRGIWSAEDVAKARPDVRYFVYDLGAEALADRTLLRPMMDAIIAGMQDGSLQPLPVVVFPIDDARNAMRFMAQARHTGKIVLRIGRDNGSTGHGAFRISSDATYWITGGLGALGLETADWLVQGGARYLVLSGRQPPGESVKAKLSALKEKGAYVRILQADAADRRAMISVCDSIARDMPPLAGVVHAAGAVRDAVLLNQSREQAQEVLRGKAHGAWLLHDLTREMPLDFFILFSAAGVVLGAPGQGVYAAANAQLDALARARRKLGLPALSVAWGPWADVGMAAEQERRNQDVWQERGLGKIRPHDGFANLTRLLASDAEYGAVIPINWPRFMAGLPDGADRDFFADVAAVPTSARRQPASIQGNAILERVRALPWSQRRQEVLAQLSEQVRLLLDLDGGVAFDTRCPLKDLGLDSLMAVELRNVLVRFFGKPLSATLVFDHPTLDAMTQHLMTTWDLEADVASIIPTRPVAPSAAVVEIAKLSDQDAETLLLRELELSVAERGL